MGRPSKLDQRQWAEIGRRLAAGERMADLSKEFKISMTTLKERFSKRVSVIREAAVALAEAEVTIERLPISDQISARTLADRLKGMQSDYLDAASMGLQASRNLQRLALQKSQDLGSAPQPDDIRMLNAIGDTTNKLAQMGTNLLQAHKESTKEAAVAGPYQIITGVPE